MDYSDYTSFFSGKRVTVIGLGLLGRGVGDAVFIAEHGGIVTVTDMKSEEVLAESVAALASYPVTFHLGGHREEDFTDADMVIKAAGVPLDSPYIEVAQSAGVPVHMSTALAARFAMAAGATIVGVTGTRGKTTVAHMIHHTLAAAGKRTHLGGNIRGISTLALVPAIRERDYLVLELDSWQLQGFGYERLSPNVAVFTNLMPDHQNYYPDMDVYFADKANIFRFQKAGDTLIATPELATRISGVSAENGAYRKDIHAPIPSEWGMKLLGEHNRVNAALAAAALEALGLAEEEIKSGLATFAGVEGRLQFVREVDLPAQAGGVKIYNDNNATTPEATIAALEAMTAGKILLIMGGSDKGLEMNSLIDTIRARCKGVFLLAGTGTERVLPHLPDEPVFDSIENALIAAKSAAVEGDCILFSPAFASFGMFRNEYDRNDRFLKAVETL